MLGNEVFQRSICIFCGSQKTTKEHVWSRWLNKIAKVPYEEKARGSHTVTKMVKGERRASRGQFTNAGNSLSATTKVVCKECNNGWMSEIESKMKDSFHHALQPDRQKMNAVDCRALREWTYLKLCLLMRAYPPVHWVDSSQLQKDEWKRDCIIDQCEKVLMSQWEDFRGKRVFDIEIYLGFSADLKWGGHNYLVGAPLRADADKSAPVVSGIAIAGYFLIGPIVLIFATETSGLPAELDRKMTVGLVSPLPLVKINIDGNVGSISRIKNSQFNSDDLDGLLEISPMALPDFRKIDQHW